MQTLGRETLMKEKGLAMGMKINLRCDLILTFLLYSIILWNLLNLLFIKYKIGIPHSFVV